TFYLHLLVYFIYNLTHAVYGDTMYETIPRLQSVNFSNRSVLMRADFNVPFDKKTRTISSDKRINAALPTIQHILAQNPRRLILMSHLGKPKKMARKEEDFQEILSLDIVANRLSELLNVKVTLVKDYLAEDIPEEGVILLENVRFHYDAEQSKDDLKRKAFAERLASFGEVFVNDAFGTCHRKEASVYDVAKQLPSCIGFLVEKEVEALCGLIDNPKKPYIALLGGAKVEDKINVIAALAPKVDAIIIMGAMEFAFRKAQGKNVGASLCIGVDVAQKALAEFGDKIVLPLDTVIAEKSGEEFTNIRTVPAGEIPDNFMGLDAGEKTIALIQEKCKDAQTIFWNGPAGMFEVAPFDKGTTAIAKALSELQNTRIVGGGDSVTAVEQAGVQDSFTHVSTGGGASLELLEKGSLPALDVLVK
ncbi:MAG: phosphoglycerate kinase, partial [Candidatus Woesearchaeota archaeon]